MEFNGLMISLLILIGLALVCHISHWMYSDKSNFGNVDSVPTKYNVITYYKSGTSKDSIPCSALDQSQANIPCDIFKKCNMGGGISDADAAKLSESELANIYKYTYETLARKVMLDYLKQ